MGKGFQHVGEVESRLAKKMVEDNISWKTILKVTGRSRDTINKILNKTKGNKNTIAKGQPRKLDDAAMESVVQSMKKLQKQKHPKGIEVTAAMIVEDSGVNVSEKTLLRELHDRGFKFYRLKERQTLTDDDVKERKAWAQARMGRRATTWVTKPHAIIDNKNWPLYTTGAGRSHAARRSIRGAFQELGDEPEGHMVKPKGGNVKFPAQSVQVTAAVIDGRIRMWEYVGGRWNGEKAAIMYKGPLVKAMKKAFPNQAKKANAKWVVLEDNDPTGYKSSEGMSAKRLAGITTDDLPRRSPDLNVLDYALWHAINLRMRKQEASWPSDMKESADEYKQRLRKTALGLPRSRATKCAGDMARRCGELCKRKGQLFRE